MGEAIYSGFLLVCLVGICVHMTYASLLPYYAYFYNIKNAALHYSAQNAVWVLLVLGIGLAKLSNVEYRYLFGHSVFWLCLAVWSIGNSLTFVFLLVNVRVVGWLSEKAN
jgi:hypothetical protein